MDNRDRAKQLGTMTPSVPSADHGTPPANRGILPADCGIPEPPPSTDKSKLLPPPTPSTKGKKKDKDGSNVGGHLTDLAKNGSEDGTSTPTDEEARTIPQAPTEKAAPTIPPVHTAKEASKTLTAPTEKEAGITAPPPTGMEAGMTPEKPTHPKPKGTPKPDWPDTLRSTSSSSDDDDTDDEDYLRCFLEWLGLNSYWKRTLDNETKMLAHQERKVGNEAVPGFQNAVNKDPR